MLMGRGLKSYAAVNWQFQVGGMLSKRYGANGDFLNDDDKFVGLMDILSDEISAMN